MDEQEGMIAGADGRVTADAAAHARLPELAALCDFCRTSFHETATRFHWQPAVPSVGALMARAVPSPDPKLATPRPETGHRPFALGVRPPNCLQTCHGTLRGTDREYARPTPRGPIGQPKLQRIR